MSVVCVCARVDVCCVGCLSVSVCVVFVCVCECVHENVSVCVCVCGVYTRV